MSTGDRPKTRVVIYGSCVSRDTFEFLDPDQFQLDRYIARQSLISAYSVPTAIEEFDLGRLTSDFQRRTVRDDFRGSLHEDLMALGPAADAVLWDLTDERLGVWDLGGGRYVTRSVELIASGIDRLLQADGRHIGYGSREHRTLWGRAVRQFAASVRGAGFDSPPILIAPPWAAEDEQGRKVVALHAPDAARANRVLARYVARAGSVTTLSAQGCPIVASSSHQWGPAPYHYADQVYEAIAAPLTGHLRTP